MYVCSRPSGDASVVANSSYVSDRTDVTGGARGAPTSLSSVRHARIRAKNKVFFFFLMHATVTHGGGGRCPTRFQKGIQLQVCTGVLNCTCCGYVCAVQGWVGLSASDYKLTFGGPGGGCQLDMSTPLAPPLVVSVGFDVDLVRGVQTPVYLLSCCFT